MGFFEILEKLRNKPEEFRKKVAFLAALILTAVIFFVWLGVTYFMPHSPDSKVAESSPGPFDVLKQTFKDIYGKFKK
jgi:amino acid transporter